jgi:hypothetical protein
MNRACAKLLIALCLVPMLVFAQLIGPNGAVTVAIVGPGNTPGVPGTTITTPDQIANLFAWYKADNLVTNAAGTTPPADNDTIKGWGDSSGNNRVLTPAASNPTWRNAATTGRTIGGFQFSATTRMRVGWTAFNGSTVFALWRNNSSGATHMVVDSTNTANRQSVYISGADAFACYSGNAFVTTGVAANPSFNRQTVIFVNAGNDTIRTNGVVAISSSDSGSDTFDGITVGSQWDGGNNLGTGEYVCEVIVYNRNLNSTECGQVEAYLATR